jgi:hypothetical protein
MLTSEIYRESLLLSHLARSIASDACAADPGCNADWRHLEHYGDADTQKLLDSTWVGVTRAIDRPDLAEKQISALSPMDAATAAWDVTGTIKTSGAGHIVATPAGHDPLVEAYLRKTKARTKAWKWVLGTGAAAAVGIGVGVLVGRAR